MKNSRDLESGTIEISEAGYCLMTHTDNSRICIEELRRREAAIINLFQGKSYPVLIDTRDRFIQFDADARCHTDNAKVVDNLIVAEAFVVNSVGIKLLIRDHITNNKGDFPIRMFSNFDEAKSWISQFIA